MCNYNKRIVAVIMFFSPILVGCGTIGLDREKLVDAHEQIGLQRLNTTNYLTVAHDTNIESPSMFEKAYIPSLVYQQDISEKEKVNDLQLQLASTVPTIFNLTDKNRFIANSEENFNPISSRSASMVPRSFFSRDCIYRSNIFSKRSLCMQDTGVIFIAKDGHQVQFIDESCKEALVEERLPQPLKRTLYLRVIKENPQLQLQDLIAYNTHWQQDNIQVYFPEQDPKGEGRVYIGTRNRGLVGGMKKGGGANSGNINGLNPFKPLIYLADLLIDETCSTFSTFRYECERLAKNSQILNAEDIEVIDYSPEFRESIKQIKEELEALINQIREISRQSAIDRKLREEKEKEAAVVFQRLVERMEENIKKQRKIAEKRGPEFMAGAEKLDVEGIKDCIDNMQQDLAEVSITIPLSKEQQEDIRFIVGEINRKAKELKEACQNITSNIDHSDIECHMDYDREDLVIVRKLLKDLKNYKEEIRLLLAIRGENTHF